MTTDNERNGNLRRLRSRPVCIICGRPAEAQRIAQALGIDSDDRRISGHDVSLVKDGYTFWLGEFKLQSGNVLKYYITSSLRMGIQSFTISAAILVNILAPRFILHAGVCAGFDDPKKKLKLNLRDVVFGEAAINYEEGKVELSEAGDPVFLPDFNRVSIEGGYMQAFVESRKHDGMHYGEYISGSAVRGDAASIFDRIRSMVNRNAIALDMEASAFIQLCRHFEPNGPMCLGIVKGVSDFGNAAKGKEPEVYGDALDKTAFAIMDWITHQIPDGRWDSDESNEPGAKLVSGYYENFVRRVVDNYLEGMEIKYRHRGQEEIPSLDIRGFISVLPKDRDPEFLREHGLVHKTMEKYGVEEIYIGRNNAQRYLYYKGGYFLDWCRTLNSLCSEEDAEYQVGVFERVLKKQAYYKEFEGHTPLARVLSWEEAMQLLEEIKEAPKAAQRNPPAPVQMQTKPPVERAAKAEMRRRGIWKPSFLSFFSRSHNHG